MVFELSKAVRPNILALRGYTCAQRRSTSDLKALLDANENAMGPCTLKFAALNTHRYPDCTASVLRERIASFRGVSVDRVFVGVGSTEIMDLLFRTFCSPCSNDHVIIMPPTFEMYAILAQIQEIRVQSIPLTPEFDLDVQAVTSRIDIHTKIVFVCSPGNPTGKLIPNAVIERLLLQMENGIVVVDEAYIDFSEAIGALSLLDKYSNLVILQTMSKSFGLAGIRLGMAFASPSLVAILDAVKLPYNVNRLTIDVASSAFDDLSRFHQNISTIKANRFALQEQLRELPFVLRVYHSDANFILVKMTSADFICDQMECSPGIAGTTSTAPTAFESPSARKKRIASSSRLLIMSLIRCTVQHE